MPRVESSRTGEPHCGSHCHDRTAAPPLPITLPLRHCLFNTPHSAQALGAHDKDSALCTRALLQALIAAFVIFPLTMLRKLDSLKYTLAPPSIQKRTRALSSLWDSLMFGRIPRS